MLTPPMELDVPYGSSSALRPQRSLRLEKVSKVIAPNESTLTIGGRVSDHTSGQEPSSSGGKLPDGYLPDGSVNSA